MKGKSIKSHRQTNVKNKARRQRISKNQLTDLLIYGFLVTEKTKAKLLSSKMDRIITYAKKNTLASKREILKKLVVKKIISSLDEKDGLFKKLDELAKKYQKRNGGYTRVLNYGFRRGDGSKIAIITFV